MRSSWCASASNTALDSAFNFSGRFNVSVATPPLSSRWTRSLIARLLLTIPPPAPERLKQPGGVGKPVAFGLYQRQLGLLIGLFGLQHRDHADGSEFSLTLGKIERPLRRALSLGARLECIGVRLQGPQR